MGQTGLRVLVYTNLYPSSTAPTHGSFVQERIEQLRRRLGFEYRVVHPVPLYPPFPGRSLAARHSRLPAKERVGDVEVAYPRYFHVPRYGLDRQAQRMVRGSRREFQRIVREFEPDFVDAHYLYPDGCAAIRLARECGLPCIVTARGSDATELPHHPGVRQQLEEMLPRAARRLAVSADLARRVATLAKVDAGEVLVVPNGVDCTRFQPATLPGLRRLVTLCHLIPRKRLDLLIRALAEPAGAGLPELVVLGDGPERPRLEELARERGVRNRVDFRGELSRDEVAREMARGGVFALPSRLEGCPNAVIEALACGLPVVATAVNGIPDIMGDSDAGMLLPLEAGPDEWARALAEVVGRFDENGGELARKARRRGEQLSWDGVLDLLENVFADMAA